VGKKDEGRRKKKAPGEESEEDHQRRIPID